MMLAMAALLMAVSGTAQGQEAKSLDCGVFNHLGVNVGVGLEGISVGVATPLTKYLEMEAGVDIVPNVFELSGDLDVPSQDIRVTNQGMASYLTTPDLTVDAKGKFSWTMFHVKANVYPFGDKSGFFVAAGFSFGGRKLAKLSGRSEELRSFADQHPEYRQQILNEVKAELADYDISFNDDFSIEGDVRCKGFRPYVGLGFGRLVPKHRVGFRMEVGCQFMGKMKVYQNDQQLDVRQIVEDAEMDDNISKFIDNWKWYPCLKFSLTGRIL